ncbi:MAG: hypothetical protein GC136_02295 [Alphaproteobacteria bacterium]|nr:hypothetical protein [Alphaproteobacteria bacterium]
MQSDLTNFLRYLGHTKSYTLKGIIVGLITGLVLFLVIPAQYNASVIIAAKESLYEIEGSNNASYGELQGRSIGPTVATFVYTVESPRTISKLLGSKATQANIRKIQKRITSRVLYPDPFVEIRLAANTPAQAEETLGQLIAIANAEQKEKVVAQTNERIAYLQKRLQNLYDPLQKQEIANLLRNEEMKAVDAGADPYVSIEIVDALYADDKRDFPQLPMLLGLFGFAGLLLALFIYHLRQAAK